MSNFPEAGMTFGILGDNAAVGRTLDDTLNRIKRFAADVGRIRAEVQVGVRNEADSLFARRSAGGLSGLGGGAMAASGLSSGGAMASRGGISAISQVSRGLQAVTMVESTAAVAGGVVAGMSAAADALKGDSKAALNKLADFGDSLKEMKGPLGSIVRTTSDLTDLAGEWLGFGDRVAKRLADAEKVDAKTGRLEARNKIMRGVNEGFEAITKAEADRRAKVGGTPAEQELVELRREIANKEKLRAANAGQMGFDDAGATAAIAALRGREKELESKAAAERQAREREHQEALTQIQAKGHADRLKAEGYAQGAERAALVEKHRQESQAILDAMIGASPVEQGKLRGKFDATKAAHAGEAAAFEAKVAAELAAFDADAQRREDERKRASGEAASDFAASAGKAGLDKEKEREAIAEAVRDANFEGRQAMLRGKGFNQRAELEAIQHQAAEELRTAEKPELRAAIRGRAESELRALLRDVEGNPRQMATVAANPMSTAFGRGGPGVSGSEMKEVDTTLKGPILKALNEIRDNVKDSRALTS